MKRIAIIFLILIVISGCSFSKVYTDAIEQTEEHLMDEEFDKALESVQIALNEKEDDEIAMNIESGLLKYQKLIRHKEKREWDDVSDVIDSFGTLDSVHPKLKKQVDEVKKLMLEQVNLETKLEDDLAEIESDIDNNLFEEADLLLVNLETDEAFDFAQEEIVSMRKEYEEEFKKFKKQEKIAERTKKLDDLLLKYETELIKAGKVEKEMKKTKKNNQSDKTLKALEETETAYDEVLNKVYQSIIKELPKKEDDLREIQREWLVNYEEEMLDGYYSSGEYEALEVSIKMKKERTKELLTEYFK